MIQDSLDRPHIIERLTDVLARPSGTTSPSFYRYLIEHLRALKMFDTSVDPFLLFMLMRYRMIFEMLMVPRRLLNHLVVRTTRGSDGGVVHRLGRSPK